MDMKLEDFYRPTTQQKTLNHTGCLTKATDLRHSALFPIYDNPHECMPCPHENAAPVDALLDVLIDKENDSIWPYSLAKANWSSDSTQDKNPIVQKNYKDDDDAKEYDVVKNDNLKDDDVNGEENASKNDL